MLISQIVPKWRRLVEAPGYTVTSVSVFALGLAAFMGAYSVLYAVLWKPPALTRPDTLVQIALATDRTRVRGAMSWTEFEWVREVQGSFERLCASFWFRAAVLDSTGSELIPTEAVSGEYFSTLGLVPTAGRLIVAADESEARAVAVLSHRLWRTRYGSDPSIIGTTLTLVGQPIEIVGVAAPEFDGIVRGLPSLLWIPATFAQAISLGRGGSLVPHRDEDAAFAIVARMRSGVSLRSATTELSLLAAQRETRNRGTFPGGSRSSSRSQWVVRDIQEVDTAGLRFALPTAAVGCLVVVLLLACASVANVTLARLVSRRHEMSVRISLGASRWQLVCAQVVETALLAIVGIVAALVIANAGIQWGAARIHSLGGPTVPSGLLLDGHMFLVVGIAFICSILVAGVWPALQFTRRSLWTGLQSEGAATSQNWRLQRRLVVLQVAGSVALLVVAAVFVVVLQRESSRDTGIDTDGLAVSQIDFRLNGRSDSQGAADAARILEAVKRQPGITSGALSVGLPFGVITAAGTVSRSDQPLADPRYAGESVYVVTGTSDLLKALGVSVNAGKDLSDEVEDGREVILSRSLADRLLGAHTGLGRTVLLRRLGASEVEVLTVIGIAEDTDGGRVGRRTNGIVYLPLGGALSEPVIVSARSAASAHDALGILRRVIRQIDPQLAITNDGTADTVLKAPHTVLRVIAITVGSIGVTALAIGMVGLYGLLSQAMKGRTREIGIRMAVGADRRRILGLAMRDGMRPVLDGVILGCFAAIVLRLVLRATLVFPIDRAEPLAFVIVAIPLLAVTVMACIGPALYAARTDPVCVLREM